MKSDESLLVGSSVRVDKVGLGSIRNRVAVNFSWLMIGEIAGKLMAFFSTIYLARVLGSSQFGMLSFATAFLAYGMLLTDFGLSTYGTREVARKSDNLDECIRDVQSTRLVLAVVLTMLASIASILILRDSQMKILFVFTFFGLIPYAMGLDWVFRGLEKMHFSAVWNVIQQMVFLSLVLLMVSNSHSLAVVPVCKALGCLAASIYLVFVFKKLGGNTGHVFSFSLPSFSRMKGMLKAGVPLAAAYLMVQVYWNIDTIILGIIDKPKAVGVYSAAYRVVLLSANVCYAMTNSFYPALSHDYRHDFAKYKKRLIGMLWIVSALGMVAAVSTFFLRHVIVSRLFGIGYEGAVSALSVLCIAIFGDFLISALGTGFVSAGRERLSLAAVAIGAVSNIGLNIILIPKYSFIGAGVATVISYALMAVFYLVNLPRILAWRSYADQEK